VSSLLKKIKATIKLLLDCLGLQIRKVQPESKLNISSEISHSNYSPLSTYSPWKNNKKFRRVYRFAKKYSLVDEFRMFELYQLASQAAKINGDFLEIGVWKGGTSAIIGSALIENEGAEKNFYIADTFEGVVKTGSKDDLYMGNEHSNASVEDVKDLFDKIKLPKPEILVGIFPDDHNHLEINSLAFVHCDVDVYDSTKDIIDWCIPRMESGGIIVFDDYGFYTTTGVTRYVNELFKKEDISKDFIMVHNLNGHAILIKK